MKTLRLVSIKDDIREIQPAAMREKIAARYVHLSINTFRQKVHDGEIVAHRRGKQRLFLKWDLDSYLNSLPLDDPATRDNDCPTSSPTNPKERRNHGR